MTAPKPIVVCFEAHAQDGKVWGIREGRRWTRHTAVLISVMVESVYTGKTRQPRAYFRPRSAAAVSRFKNGTAWIRPAGMPHARPAKRSSGKVIGASWGTRPGDLLC